MMSAVASKNNGEDFVDQILTSLRVVSMIKEGQKVCIRNGTLTLEVKSTGVSTAVRRWINNDSRQNTLRYIRNIISNALDLSSIHGDEETIQKISAALSDCLTGLGCLTVTYSDDASVTATIEVMCDRIKTHISKM